MLADERVLWYSEADRDWNISPGLVPDPVILTLSAVLRCFAMTVCSRIPACKSAHAVALGRIILHEALCGLQRLVMAFGGGDAEPRPNLVSQHKWWYVKQELVSVEDMFIKGDGLRVECLEADPDVDL